MRRSASLIGAALVALASAEGLASPASEWEMHFPTAGAPAAVYFKARYLDESGAPHTLEVWRDDRKRLRRTTDGTIDLSVWSEPSGETTYRLVDRPHRMVLRADRTSLYRLGRFSEWRGLAHVLDVPRRDFAVATEPAIDGPASQDCTWRKLTVENRASPVRRVCWSSRWGLPLEIRTQRSQGWETRFQVLDVHAFEPAEAIFAVDESGLVELDARGEGEVAD